MMVVFGGLMESGQTHYDLKQIGGTEVIFSTP